MDKDEGQRDHVPMGISAIVEEVKVKCSGNKEVCTDFPEGAELEGEWKWGGGKLMSVGEAIPRGTELAPGRHR